MFSEPYWLSPLFCNWRSADVLREQAIQVARAQTDARRERLDGNIVECAVLNQAKRATHDCGSPEPRRRAGRRLGTAAQARPKARLHRRRRRRVIPHVLLLRARRGAHRSAIHAGCRHGDEELAVEARIATEASAIERGVVESEDVHAATIAFEAAAD